MSTRLSIHPPASPLTFSLTHPVRSHNNISCTNSIHRSLSRYFSRYSKLDGSARWRSEQAVMIKELQVFELLFDSQAWWLYVVPMILLFFPCFFCLRGTRVFVDTLDHLNSIFNIYPHTTTALMIQCKYKSSLKHLAPSQSIFPSATRVRARNISRTVPCNSKSSLMERGCASFFMVIREAQVCFELPTCTPLASIYLCWKVV